jgi:hypothetical protein
MNSVIAILLLICSGATCYSGKPIVEDRLNLMGRVVPLGDYNPAIDNAWDDATEKWYNGRVWLNEVSCLSIMTKPIGSLVNEFYEISGQPITSYGCYSWVLRSRVL